MNWALYPKDNNSVSVDFVDGQTKGYILAILSMLLMSSTFVINYVALQSVNISTLTFYFFSFSLFGAIVLILVTRRLAKTKQMLRKYWKPLAILGLVNGVTAIVWFFALKLAGPFTLGSLMRFSTVFTVVIGVIYLKEAFNRGEKIATVLMILGAVLITFKGAENILTSVVIALVLSLVFSLEQLYMKKYVKHIEHFAFNALRLIFTFMVIALYTVVKADLMLVSQNVTFIIFLGAMLGPVIGFMLYFKALEFSELSKLATIQSLNPFAVFVYSLIFLGSVPTGLQFVGGVVIGVGAFLLVLARHRPRIIERFLPNF